MQMPGKREIRRYLRRVRRSMHRKRRRAAAALFLAAALYLLSVSAVRGRIWSITETQELEVRLSGRPEKGQSTRLVLRLRTGELLIIHEEAPEQEPCRPESHD
jgi:hypothetical protein